MKLELLQACKEFPQQFVMVETCRAQEIAFDATAAEGCAISRKLYPLWHAQARLLEMEFIRLHENKID